MRLITLGVGAALGYFLGSREGRQNLNKMSDNAQKFWNDPKTQDKVSKVQGQATQKWEQAKSNDKVQNLTSTVQHKVDDAKAKVSGNGGAKADADVVSDPSTPMSAEGPTGSQH